LEELEPVVAEVCELRATAETLKQVVARADAQVQFVARRRATGTD